MKYTDTENQTLTATIRTALEGKAKPNGTKLLPPLTLAYIGDTVYDLFVRTALVTETTLTAHGLHLRAVKSVCAKAQAEVARRLEPLLTDEEAEIFRRGRNSHIGIVPKNASVIDYRMATALEAVVGWLYLSGQDKRLCELMNKALTEGGGSVKI